MASVWPRVGSQLHPDKKKMSIASTPHSRSLDLSSVVGVPREERKIFTSFLPAVSKDALKKMSATVRSWRLHRRTGLTVNDLAREINPVVRLDPVLRGLRPQGTVSPPSARQLLPGALAPQEIPAAAHLEEGCDRMLRHVTAVTGQHGHGDSACGRRRVDDPRSPVQLSGEVLPHLRVLAGELHDDRNAMRGYARGDIY